MAIMRPSKFPQHLKNQCDREDFVYEMLEKNLPADAVVIYEPLVFNKKRQNRKPDFLIFWPSVGCFVMEVKNWSRKAITSADERTVYYEDEPPRTNPFRSAQSHSYALKDHLQERGTEESGLLDSTPEHKGKLSFPIMPCVVLLGTQDVDIDDWAKLLHVHSTVLISEETLKDPEALQQRIRKIPTVFPGDHDAHVLRNAADLVHEGSESEPTVEAATRSMDILKQALSESLVQDLETLTSHRRLLATVAEDLATMIAVDHEEHPSAKNLLKLRDDLHESRLRVGMFGTTAAGKSTLTNALIGSSRLEQDLMKEGLGRTTRVITRILPVGDGPENDHRCSILRYKSAEEVATELAERLEDLSILKDELPGAAGKIDLADPAHRTWLETQIQSIDEKGSHQDRDKSNAIKAFLHGWRECQALLGTEVYYPADRFEEAETLIHGTNHQHATYVAERIVFHDNRLSRHGIELIDAPGVGAAFQDDDRALQIAQSSDAFVMVTDVSFQFMEPDRRFLTNAVDVTRGKRNNLLFVLNQISKIDPDQCSPPASTFDEAVSFQVDRLRNTLSDYGVDAAKIWPVDAAVGKVSRHMKFTQSDAKTKQQFNKYRFRDLDDVDVNLAASRIDELEENLIQHLTKHTYTDVMCDKVTRLEKLMAKYEEDLGVRISSIQDGIAATQKEMEIHSAARKRVKLQLDGFFARYLPAQLEKHQAELDNDVERLVSLSIDSIIEKTRKDWYKPKATVASLVNSAIDATSPIIAKEIANVRNKHEAYWVAIREKALTEELPDILSQYGSSLSLELERKDIGEAMRRGIEALRDIQLGAFDRLFVPFWGGVIGLLTEGAPFKGARNAVTTALRSNFANRLQWRMYSDTMRWIQDDREYLGKQTLDQFTKMMDEIESQISWKLEEIQRHEHERDAYTLRLQTFRDHAEAKLQDLHEIRELIERNRPFSPAQTTA